MAKSIIAAGNFVSHSNFEGIGIVISNNKGWVTAGFSGASLSELFGSLFKDRSGKFTLVEGPAVHKVIAKTISLQSDNAAPVIGPAPEINPEDVMDRVGEKFHESMMQADAEIVEEILNDVPDKYEVSCPACKHIFETNRSQNICCPKCKAWFLIKLHSDRERYIRGLDTTASGNDTYDIDDDIADMLRGLPIEDVFSVAATFLYGLGVNCMSKPWKREFGDSPWEIENIAEAISASQIGKNLGMQRMNVGNLCRNAQRRALNIDSDARMNRK